MGCTQSKIENEEAVTRCKDRKQFMKEAVGARNAFAAAHSAYAMALKNTGAALSDYAHGEVQNPQLVAGAPHQPSASAAVAAALQPPLDPLLPPPPPPSLTTSPAPIQRAASMPEMIKIQKTRENGVGPTIEEENDGDDEEDEIESNEKLIMRKRSSGRNRSGDHQKKEEAGVPQERARPTEVENSESMQSMGNWNYDYFFQTVDHYPGPSLEVKEEEVMENNESKVFDEIPKRKENVEEKRKEVPPPLVVEDVAEDVAEEERVVAESVSSSIGDSAELEGNLTLSDRLKAFKSSQFDPDAYVASKSQHMNEKEIRHLCSYLVELKKASAEEMRRCVYANYAAFIRTSKEISVLEGQLLSMRNLLATQSALVQGLAEGARIDSLFAVTEDSDDDDISSLKNEGLSNMENWSVEFLETLEVLLAERRVDEALAALEEGQNTVREAKHRCTLSRSAIFSLQSAISEQRQKLADQLAGTICQPSTRGVELRSAVLALKKLGDGPRSHTLLLKSHHQRLQSYVQSLRSSSSLSGGALTATVSQLVFSTIAQAARDSLAVFGEEPAYSSELVTWAVKETEDFALLLERHILASAAAAGGLRVVTETIQICLGHCSLLEARGLALSPVILRSFRPSVEHALSAYLKRIEKSSAALAAADDWLLAYPPAGARPFSSTNSLNTAVGSQPKLSTSAHKFNALVQELLEDIGPLENLKLDGPALDGVFQAFNSYVSLLINALPGSTENEENLEGFSNKIVSMAETESQQVALLANASLLADELLPRAALKLLPFSSNRMEMTPRRASDRQNRFPEQREWKRKLQRLVDRLRDSFCRTHALDIIFTEDGEIRLNAEIYTCMDESMEEPEWFPSPIFQELFIKLTRMASIASDMFVGRERFATILLMRLTETVILWLADDQSFWAEIEEGPKPLGPLGLQQFYLDMEFVMLFSSQGRYLSRNLQQVIKNIIARAIEVVAATGIDPYSVLPEDDWFAEIAQIAIKMLSGKATFGDDEEDVLSPTASV